MKYEIYIPNYINKKTVLIVIYKLFNLTYSVPFIIIAQSSNKKEVQRVVIKKGFKCHGKFITTPRKIPFKLGLKI